MKQAEVQEPKRTMGAKLAVQITVTDSPHWSQKIAMNQSLQDLDLCLQYIDRVTYFYY